MSINNVTIEQVIEDLNKGICVVKFIKKDGSERIMTCTRNAKYISAEFAPQIDKPLSNPNIIRAFDINAPGWRSFDFTRLSDIGIK